MSGRPTPSSPTGCSEQPEEPAREQFIGIEHLSARDVEQIRSELESELCSRKGVKANASVARLLRRL